jgi:predicted dehydrogenase
MKFGLVGSGCVGEIRARALATLPDAELTAVTDADLSRARQLAARYPTTRAVDFAELLARPDVEAVIISTPPQFHEEQACLALQAGKHVLCEKPLSNSVEGAGRMLVSARENRRVLTTGFNHRYFKAIQFVRQAIDNGAIGRLNHIRAQAGHLGLSEFRSPWEYDKAVIGGGALFDVGIHLIDLVAFLLGDVRTVSGAKTHRIWDLPGGAEDNGFALLQNSSGVVAMLQASWTEWKGYGFFVEAYGDLGMARASYAPMQHRLITMEKPGGSRKQKYRFYAADAIREKLFGWQSTVVETFRQEICDFMKMCAGNAAGSIADGFAGLRAIEIATGVYESARLGRQIELSPRPEGSAHE